MRCFRGFAKSTLLGVYNAWRYYDDPTYRILHQSEADGTAYKTSRDTQNVLRKHPLTRTMFREGGVEQWWVRGADDERNASMYAKGILSNVTSARADECQNDDVEVPRNIQTTEAREKLRYRLGEQTHILVPGGRQLYVGTPHTHDSLYDEQERLGADCLTIPMFEKEHRIEDAKASSYMVPFEPEFVFVGIGKVARLLTKQDYAYEKGRLVFATPRGGLVDCYAGSAWPERFDAAELLKRRRRTRTINAWDSQYQLHSKPINDVRLNPDSMPVYDVEPHFDRANKVLRMWLGKARIVGAAARWDPSSGKINSDVSAFALVFQDDIGRRYWHRASELRGEVAEFDESGRTITGGQVLGICDLVEKYGLRRVTVETNGIGGFAPTVLRAALKQRNLKCAVVEVHSTGNKNLRILEALEPLLTSEMLWVHVSVADGPTPAQMREWNPAISVQPDDHLDAGAGAVTEQPERVGAALRNRNPDPTDDWRPGVGVFEAELEL